ncbi:MAG TPA: FtsX-like permease family protein [Mycobacteriales bacterium]|nr:FtsX-like permease family protein [Mycobacteriales bacterium]
MNGLGWRLAVGRDRSARVRLLLMSTGVALAVALLLAVTGALPAALTRLEKGGARNVVYDDSPAARTDGVRARVTAGFWRGSPLRLLEVETLGRPVVPPPGIAALPAPGQVLVSPALAAALAGEHGDELAPRLPGAVVGTIGRAGLVGPRELYAIAGAAPGVLPEDALGRGFQGAGAPRMLVSVDNSGVREVVEGPSDALRAAVLLGGVGLVVPLLMLVVTSTRLSAASRERRAAAMRLVGATARQMRVLGAFEGLLVGVLGAVTGAGLFLLLRMAAAALLPVPNGLYASDLRPPLRVAGLVLLGVPALSAAAGVLALRRSVASPLSVSRQAAAGRAGAARLLPLAAGLLLLLGAYADRDAVLRGTKVGVALLVGGAALCLVGTAVAGAALARVSGLALAHWGRGPASQLAGRRLVLDPQGSARALTGTALVVVVVGWLLAFLPLLAQSSPNGTGQLAAALRPATVVASVSTSSTGASQLQTAVRSVGAVPDVRAVAQLRTASLLPVGARLPSSYDVGAPPTPDELPVNAVVADCGQLAAVLRAPLPGCRPDTVMALDDLYGERADLAAGTLQLLDQRGEPLPDRTATFPPDLPTLSLPAGLQAGIDGFALYGDVLVPPSLFGDAVPVGTLLVGTDGTARTVEAVRAALGGLPTVAAPVTAEEAVAQARSATDGYAQAALVGTVVVVLVGGLSLAVTTADGLRERRRAQAALAALGMPVRLLRRAVLLQTTVPLLLSVGLAIAVAAAASWLYLHLAAGDGPTVPGLPWLGYLGVGGAAALAALLATGLALPFVTSATRPEALRTE